MASNDLMVGLEIGTSKICVVVGETRLDGTTKILGVGQAPSRGVRKGEIVDFETAMVPVKRFRQGIGRGAGQGGDSEQTGANNPEGEECLGEFSSQRTKRAGSLRGGLDVGDAVKMKAKGGS